MYKRQEWETVVVTKGISKGRIKVENGGRKIMAMEKVDKESFYSYILQQWAR